MHKGRITGINAALISAFFLGLAPVFGKAAMGADKFSPYAVVALRTAMAALLLFLIMAVFRRKFLYIYPAGLIGCALAGGINGIGSIFYYVGLSKLNASVAQMLYALYPFFVAIWLRFDHQSTSWLTYVRILIAFISFVTAGVTSALVQRAAKQAHEADLANQEQTKDRLVEELDSALL